MLNILDAPISFLTFAIGTLYFRYKISTISKYIPAPAINDNWEIVISKDEISCLFLPKCIGSYTSLFQSRFRK